AADERTFDWIKRPVTRIIDSTILRNWVTRATKILNENSALVKQAQRGAKDAIEHNGKAAGGKIFDLLRPSVRSWRTNPSSVIPDLVKNAKRVGGKWVIDEESKHMMRKAMRAALDDMGYSLFAGLGSGWLSWSYSRLVKTDIQNIFRESVA